MGKKRGRSSSSESGDRKRSRSRSPNSDGGQRKSSKGKEKDDDVDARKREERERRKQEKLEEKRKLKREAKRAKEDPAERAARKAKAAVQATAARFGYTNELNPFGDSNLEDQFQWKKKSEKMGTGSAPVDKRAEMEAHKRKLEEIAKVRQRREESEREKEEMERLKAEESRLREQAQYGDWQKKEEEFHLYQAKQRTKIRLVEGRERPIDIVARNLVIFGEDDGGSHGGIRYASGKQIDTSQLEVELREPYRLCEGLTLDELDELVKEIRGYQNMESTQEGPHVDFWNALGVVAADELQKAREEAGLTSESGGTLHKSIRDDVAALLGGEKASMERLAKLHDQISARVEDGEGDVDYWTAVLNRLHVYQAKAQLKALHETMLQRQLERLEAAHKQQKESNAASSRDNNVEMEEEETEEEQSAAAAQASVDESQRSRDMMLAESKKGMEPLEDAMDLADEVDTRGTSYWWNDKYRPRKPRYFNRVKTGYDWNKYNQTHYDHDNPPPKTVQGYKFNIFYPDLIDKNVAPKFTLEKADHPDFAIIRFTAGPPYEDIAFKIVNREWEYSRKRGFRCTFERGVLSLFANFKGHRYRK